MFVADFASETATLASEICCQRERGTASHRYPSSVTVDLELSDPALAAARPDLAAALALLEEFSLDVVELRADRAMGCGCWVGIRVAVRVGGP